MFKLDEVLAWETKGLVVLACRNGPIETSMPVKFVRFAMERRSTHTSPKVR